MFSNVVQPNVVSLFSSTSTAPLQLFSKHVDSSPALRSDSLIHLLNDTTSKPSPPHPGVVIQPCSIVHDGKRDIYDENELNATVSGRTLCQTVLHIQSPTVRTTYIRCPPSRSGEDSGMELGLKLPLMHLQARNLGREWAFEVCVADRAGRKGIVRCSTFQREASLNIRQGIPLMHIPLYFPNATSRPLSSWCIVSLDLGLMIEKFRVVASAQRSASRSTAISGDEDDSRRASYDRILREDASGNWNVPLPAGALGKVIYVKVYANCRLRRIWFSEDRVGIIPWEFELYTSSSE